MINKKHIVGVIAVVFMVLISSVPAFAASSSNQSVQVTVSETIAISAFWNNGANNTTITLGTLPADNLQYTFTGGATGEQIRTSSNVAIDVYTRALANFQGTDPIPLSNFLYSGGTVGTPTAFTTTYALFHSNWAKPAAGSQSTEPVDLYLTIPYGTAAGNYNTTVFFSAVRTGQAAPTTP